MEAPVNFNSISSPIGVNLIITIGFLIFYLVNKDSKPEFHKLFLGVFVASGLSYSMTSHASLTQTFMITAFIQFVLMFYYQQLELIPDWKLTPLAICLISFTSVFFSNLPWQVMISGMFFALIVSGLFWVRYNVIGKDEGRANYADLNLFIIMIASGFYFGLDNFFSIILIYLICFMSSFIFIYFLSDKDNTNLKPSVFISFSVMAWFGLVHILPKWDFFRLIADFF